MLSALIRDLDRLADRASKNRKPIGRRIADTRTRELIPTRKDSVASVNFEFLGESGDDWT